MSKLFDRLQSQSEFKHKVLDKALSSFVFSLSRGNYHTVFVDTHAGAGIYGGEPGGSPVIAMHHTWGLINNGAPYNPMFSLFCEKEQGIAKQLKEMLEGEYPDYSRHYRVLNCDSNDLAAKIVEKYKDRAAFYFINPLGIVYKNIIENINEKHQAPIEILARFSPKEYLRHAGRCVHKIGEKERWSNAVNTFIQQLKEDKIYGGNVMYTILSDYFGLGLGSDIHVNNPLPDSVLEEVEDELRKYFLSNFIEHPIRGAFNMSLPVMREGKLDYNLYFHCTHYKPVKLMNDKLYDLLLEDYKLHSNSHFKMLKQFDDDEKLYGKRVQEKLKPKIKELLQGKRNMVVDDLIFQLIKKYTFKIKTKHVRTALRQLQKEDYLSIPGGKFNAKTDIYPVSLI